MSEDALKEKIGATPDPSSVCCKGSLGRCIIKHSTSPPAWKNNGPAHGPEISDIYTNRVGAHVAESLMVLYVLAIGTLFCLIRKAVKKFSTAFLHTDFAFLIRKAVKKSSPPSAPLH